MNDVLQSIAHLLNTTTDELKSIVDVSKENLPQMYSTLVKENMQYNLLTQLAGVMMFFSMISFLNFMYASLIAHSSKEVGSRRVIWAFSVMLLFGLAMEACYAIRGVISPNYTFMLEMLNRR